MRWRLKPLTLPLILRLLSLLGDMGWVSDSGSRPPTIGHTLNMYDDGVGEMQRVHLGLENESELRTSANYL